MNIGWSAVIFTHSGPLDGDEGQSYFGQLLGRRTFPGKAPVGAPSSITNSPFTTVCGTPAAFWIIRVSFAGKSWTYSGASVFTVAGSNTAMSAARPARNSPRSLKPNPDATRKVSLLTASSKLMIP